jgi:integrase
MEEYMAKETLSFTKMELKNLVAPINDKRRYVYDEKESGLLLQITKAGKKTFQVYKKHQGQPVRVTLGVFPDMTVEQARKKARETKTLLDRGENPNDTLRQQRQEMTFADLFREYMERHSKIQKKTWREDQRYYDRHLANSLGKKKLSNITKRDIAAIHSKIGKEHQIHANRVFALISSVFGKAIGYGLWEDMNPCQGIAKFSEKSRDRFLGKGELPRFFEALQEEPNETIRDYFLVSLLTGARRSNVLAMRWKEITIEDATWRIPETKNGTPQTVTLGEEVLEILRHRRKNTRSFFVFPGPGKTGHLVEPKRGWKRLLNGAGIEDLRIHDLRRTLGSWQAKTGASLAIIGKSLNHKSQSTTAIYARLDIDPIRESVDKAVSAMLEAANTGKK